MLSCISPRTTSISEQYHAKGQDGSYVSKVIELIDKKLTSVNYHESSYDTNLFKEFWNKTKAIIITKHQGSDEVNPLLKKLMDTINSINDNNEIGVDNTKNHTVLNEIKNTIEEGILTRVTPGAALEEMPAELMREIAYNLNASDYVNLGKTCKNINHALDDFHSIENKLKYEGCPGRLREKLYNLLSTGLLSDDSVKNIILGMETPFVKDGVIQAQYFPDASKTLGKSNVVDLVGIIRVNIKHDSQIHCISIMHGGRDGVERGLRSLGFNYEKMTIASLEGIFHSFNILFNEKEGAKKLIVAVIATELKDYWCEKPPTNSMDKGVITACASPYHRLFTIGEMTKNAIREYKQTELNSVVV